MTTVPISLRQSRRYVDVAYALANAHFEMGEPELAAEATKAAGYLADLSAERYNRWQARGGQSANCECIDPRDDCADNGVNVCFCPVCYPIAADLEAEIPY